jgi:steroid 5-alpha reductase family enzyme
MSYTVDLIENLGVSAGALFVCLFCLWLISLKVRDASLIDIFWGAGFGIVALICLVLSEVKTPYVYLLTALPIIWAVRLSLYLAVRNLGHGEDPRYVAMQRRAAKKGMSEAAWRKRAFFTIFLGQGLLIIIVSAPIWWGVAAGHFYHPEGQPGAYELQETQIGGLAIGGALLWLIGFLFEAVGDLQLRSFMKSMKDYDGAYEDKPVLDTGLWKYTRHPNYFGNACMWWGIWLVACQTPMAWMTIFAPIVMTILLTRVSGRDLLERKLKKRPAYADYVARTSGFFPWFPRKG